MLELGTRTGTTRNDTDDVQRVETTRMEVDMGSEMSLLWSIAEVDGTRRQSQLRLSEGQTSTGKKKAETQRSRPEQSLHPISKWDQEPLGLAESVF